MSRKKYAIANVTEVYNKSLWNTRNKYYAIFKAKYKWNGVNYREKEFIMNKFYSVGKVAAFKIPLVGLGFADWVMVEHDMYGLPEKVNLVNEWGSPLIPNKVLTVDTDAVVGYVNSQHKPIQAIVDYYAAKIAEVETALWVNLQHQKIPFLITYDDTTDNKSNKFSAEELATRIISGELVVGADGIDINSLNCFKTDAPYLIDKLQEYKTSLENELKTLLGVDNQGAHLTREQMQLDEINSNNEEINSLDDDMLNNLKQFCDNVKEFLGIDISVEIAQERVTSIGEEHDAPEEYNTNKGEDNND